MSIENVAYFDSASIAVGVITDASGVGLVPSSSTALTASRLIVPSGSYTPYMVPHWTAGGWLSKQSPIQASGSRVLIGPDIFGESATPEVLKVHANPDEETVTEFKGDIDGYLQIKVEQNSTGSGASADVIVEAAEGGSTELYTDMGINSTTYYDEDYSVMPPGSGYIYTIGSGSGEGQVGGDFIIGTSSPNRFLRIAVGGMRQENQVMQMGEGYISASVPFGIGSPREGAWLSVGAAIAGTGSIHINKSTVDVVAQNAEPNMLYTGPDGGLRWVIGVDDGVGQGVLTYIPGTIFKHTKVSTISGSTAATQSFLEGVPSTGVIFPANWFGVNQNFRWDIRGSYTSTGNNRDYRLQFILQTADGGPVTRSVIVDSGVVRPSVGTVTDQGWWNHGLINVASTGSQLAFRGRVNWEFFTGAGVLNPFAIRVSSSYADNTKPLMLLAYVNYNTVYDATDTFTTEAGIIEKV